MQHVTDIIDKLCQLRLIQAQFNFHGLNVRRRRLGTQDRRRGVARNHTSQYKRECHHDKECGNTLEHSLQNGF